MKYLLIIALTILSLKAEMKYSAEMKYTYQDYSNNKQDGFYIYRNTNNLEGSLTLIQNYENILGQVKVSNRLEDKHLEKAIISYDSRHNKILYNINLGTLDTMEGIFSNSKTSRVQPPMVNKASGVYNDKWMSGLLDTVIGVEGTIGYLTNKSIISITTSTANMRISDKDKAESAVFGYSSDNVDIETVDKIKTTKIKYDDNDMNIFVSTTKFKLKSKDISGKTDLEKKIIYVLDRDNFDNAWLTVTSEPYEFTINRAGIVYTSTVFVLGTEWFSMETVNKENNTYIYNIGRYVYGALYTFDDVTPYIAYGWSNDNKEDILGIRYNIQNNVTLLAEYKKTDWVQIDDMSKYNNYVGDLKVYTLQLIYKF